MISILVVWDYYVYSTPGKLHTPNVFHCPLSALVSFLLSWNFCLLLHRVLCLSSSVTGIFVSTCLPLSSALDQVYVERQLIDSTDCIGWLILRNSVPLGSFFFVFNGVGLVARISLLTVIPGQFTPRLFKVILFGIYYLVEIYIKISWFWLVGYIFLGLTTLGGEDI